jgi:DNA (cytosine-5)-methyltransferase 1
MFAVIKEIRPRWVVAENVAGIVRMELDNCLSDLEGEGYSTQAVIIPACAVNAPHRRDRVWIVAHDRQQPARDESPRLNRQFIYGASEKFGTEKRNRSSNGSQDVADTEKQGRINGVRTGLSGRRMPRQTEVEGNGRGERRSPDGWWSTQSRLGGMVDGVPDWSHEPESVPRVAKGVKERVNRLKSLGNAIVPQVAEQIFRVIKEVEEHKENQWQPM